jgi:glycosyltransferase involved in cell wall biosynthesis
MLVRKRYSETCGAADEDRAMRILIDLQCCQSGSRNGGIGRYSLALAKAMIALPSAHQFSLLLNRNLPNENAIRSDFSDLLAAGDIHAFWAPRFVAAENKAPAKTRAAELAREAFICDISPDVLHIASLFEGAGDDTVTSVGLLYPAARTAITLYDLIPFLERSTYFLDSALQDHYMRKFGQMQAAGALLAISEFSRTEVIEQAHISPSQVVNVSSAVEHGKFAPSVTLQAGSVLARCRISRPFVMMAGNFETRKNHARLIEAFALAQKRIANPHQLVIAGGGSQQQLELLREVVHVHGLRDADVMFVGRITDEELVTLYSHCALFVCPSLREGFGLPVLEAMACGAPTIGSNCTSIPEVIARPEALFDPQSAQDMANRMVSVLTSPEIREKLRRYGLERAALYSWESSARRALERMEQLHERAKAGESQLVPGPRNDGSPGGAPYRKLQAAWSDSRREPIDDDALRSAARAIALNELEARWRKDGPPALCNVGWVTPWGGSDEVASYSRTLIDELKLTPRLFVARGDDQQSRNGRSVQVCWDRGVNEIDALEGALAAVPINIVVVQSGDNLFAPAALARLIMSQKSRGRRVFVTFHSTAAFLDCDLPPEFRAAYRSCDGVFVHNATDLTNLEVLKFRRNLHYVPPLQIEPMKKPGQACQSAAAYMLRRMLVALAIGRPLASPAAHHTTSNRV